MPTAEHPNLMTRLRDFWAKRFSAEFTCGDCVRQQSCGLPPTADCVERAAQIERDDWKARRRARWPRPIETI